MSHGLTELVQASVRLGEVQPNRHDALARERFLTAQWAHSSDAATAFGQMIARAGINDPRAAPLVRERQDLVARWQTADKAILASISQPVGQRNPVAEQALRTELMNLGTRIGAVDRRLSNEAPEYTALASAEPKTVAEVQNALGNNEVLILVAPASDSHGLPSEIVVWAITKTQVQWFRSELGGEALEEQVAALRCGLDAALWLDATDWPQATDDQVRQRTEQIARRRHCEALLNARPVTELIGLMPAQVLPFDAKRAHALYKTIFDPLRESIAGKHLLIVPDGALTSLPFSILVSEPPRGDPTKLADYRGIAWLGARQPITTLPSVASLTALRQHAKASQATRPFLGVGNPLLEGQEHDKARAQLAKAKQGCRDQRNAPQSVASSRSRAPSSFPSLFHGRHADIEKVRQWSPLPETADELCDVGQRLGAAESDILLGGSATETTLKSMSETGKLAQYMIVHFATHGALSGQVQGAAEPGLILTPPTKGSRDAQELDRDDGFLTASEIATLKLDANLVILSACNTAAGKGENSEALSGMARAFFYAGARALLVSHWEVGSDAAVRLTTRAFSELKAQPGIGRAEAFRLSMRELIERGQPWEAHPEMWAPFVVVGEGAR